MIGILLNTDSLTVEILSKGKISLVQCDLGVVRKMYVSLMDFLCSDDSCYLQIESLIILKVGQGCFDISTLKEKGKEKANLRLVSY